MKINLNNAQIEKISTRKDRTISIHIGMQELPPNEMADLFASLNNDLHEVKVDLDQSGGKSQGQRLRDVLWVMWDKCVDDNGCRWNEIYKDSNLFYAFMMDKIVNHYKKKLPKD